MNDLTGKVEKVDEEIKKNNKKGKKGKKTKKSETSSAAQSSIFTSVSAMQAHHSDGTLEESDHHEFQDHESEAEEEQVSVNGHDTALKMNNKFQAKSTTSCTILFLFLKNLIFKGRVSKFMFFPTNASLRWLLVLK